MRAPNAALAAGNWHKRNAHIAYASSITARIAVFQA